MPITKRLPHLGTPKNLLEYILDEKNYGEKLGSVSSLNCNVETAFYEYKDIQDKYKMKGVRSAYHIIQSFSPKDKITVDEANEIGLKLCKELYPNYQCVIATHIDKGHIHNHISVNAINLSGTKLEDRLANKKEGLYGLSDASDRIAAKYGCFIMPKKVYQKSRKRDYYYQYKRQTWKEQIKEDIEKIIDKCSSIEELLDKLSIQGYEIRRGKHISIKAIGMQRFARIDTINTKYSTNNLYKLYRDKTNIKLASLKTNKNEYNSYLFQKANESKSAIEISQLATEGKIYSEYQKTKYQEIRRYYQLKQQLEYLDKYNIHNFNDVENEIAKKRNQIKSKNVDMKKKQERFNKILKQTEMANDYIRLYKVYEYAMSYKKIDKDYIFPLEVDIFLKLQDTLDISSVDEAKQLIKDSRTERIEINKQRKEVLELQRELNHLETIKEEKLSSSNLFIHNIKFGGNRIDYKNSDDKDYCINLPYTNLKIHIDKRYTAYNEKHQFYTLYLVDDKEYEIYDENNKKIGKTKGTELEKLVLDKKKEIDSLYSK